MADQTPTVETELNYHHPESHDAEADTTKLSHQQGMQQKTSSCECYKTWSSMKFILYSIIIALFAALLAGIFSNIDRMIESDDSSFSDSGQVKDYCIGGVYEGNHSYDSLATFVWNYNDLSDSGPSIWSQHYPQCGCQSHQSPRNIDTEYSRINTPSQLCSDNSSLLQWKIDENYTKTYNGTFEVFHNQHTVLMKSINYKNDSLVPIAMLDNLWQPINSTLHSQFRLEQIHFHWGTDVTGSPHTINGKHYPLTIHFVHYSSDYNSIGQAFVDWRPLHDANKDRYILAVVGAFYQVDVDNNNHNDAFDQLLQSEVLNSPESEQGFVETIDLNKLLPSDIGSYYYYPGSMTTPPCAPIVRWHLLSEPLKINQDQIDKFKSLANEQVEFNSRPIQDNTNPVYSCHANHIQQ